MRAHMYVLTSTLNNKRKPCRGPNPTGAELAAAGLCLTLAIWFLTRMVMIQFIQCTTAMRCCQASRELVLPWDLRQVG